MAASATTGPLQGAIVINGHEIGTFEFRIPVTLHQLTGGDVSIELTPISPIIASTLRDMADALDKSEV